MPLRRRRTHSSAATCEPTPGRVQKPAKIRAWLQALKPKTQSCREKVFDVCRHLIRVRLFLRNHSYLSAVGHIPYLISNACPGTSVVGRRDVLHACSPLLLRGSLQGDTHPGQFPVELHVPLWHPLVGQKLLAGQQSKHPGVPPPAHPLRDLPRLDIYSDQYRHPLAGSPPECLSEFLESLTSLCLC